VYNQRNHYMKPHTYTNRSLCECELYAPSNYDNDPEMKAVMQGFDRQTSQRFEEYNERLLENKQKCKEQCNKEIQKIILKDKLEKELMDKIVTLDTDIQSDAIPTCVCEKSVADKVEKTCLKCAGVLGGGVTPAWGLISGIVYTGWKTAALAAATKEAIAEAAAKGAAAGLKAGVKSVISEVSSLFGVSTIDDKALGLVINATNYRDAQLISGAIYKQFEMTCMPPGALPNLSNPICISMWSKFVSTNGSSRDLIKNNIKTYVQSFVSQAETTAAHVTKTTTEKVTTELTTEKTGEIAATYMGYQTPIIASIVAILVIVLVMVIIYLILRYRRKKKMKKKLQYIKLLEE
ncbi:hypothetical protein PFNF54_00600, partial [Plasmodium falciparum NF54]